MHRIKIYFMSILRWILFQFNSLNLKLILKSCGIIEIENRIIRDDMNDCTGDVSRKISRLESIFNDTTLPPSLLLLLLLLIRYFAAFHDSRLWQTVLYSDIGLWARTRPRFPTCTRVYFSVNVLACVLSYKGSIVPRTPNKKIKTLRVNYPERDDAFSCLFKHSCTEFILPYSALFFQVVIPK